MKTTNSTSSTTTQSGFENKNTINPEMAKAAMQNSEPAPSAKSLDEIKKFHTTEECKRLTDWILKEYRTAKSQLDSMKSQWNMNLSFYKGDQYVDRIENRLVNIPAPKSKVRLVVNRIRPHVRTEVARLTSVEPTAEVVPATSETSDIEAAKAAQSLLLSTFDRLDIQRKVRSAAWWASVTGVGYLKVRWNKDAEIKYENGEVVKGDFAVSVPSPFHIVVPNLLLEDIEDQPWVFNVFAMKHDQVKARYSDLWPDKYTPTLISSSEIMDETRLNIKGSSSEAQADSCLVIEAWIKPGQTNILPKGGMVTIVDQIVVGISDQGIPYTHGQFPFIKIDNVQSGSYYGTSSIDDLIPLQKELNKIRSVMMEARMKMGNPGLMYRQGTLDPQRMTNRIGQLVEIKGGGEYPMPLPTPSLPPIILEEHNQILADFEDISGQHQVSKGNTPTGVTAATAIDMLQEQDNTYLSATTDSVEFAMQKTAKQLIQLFIQYADSKRQVKVVGKDKAISVEYLMGADVKSATDVRVERGSSLPYSKAARVAMFTDWMSRGILPYDIGLDLIDLPHMDKYYDIVKIDERQAERENLKILNLNPEELMAEREAAENKKREIAMQYMLQEGVPPQEIQNDPELIEQFIMNDPQMAQMAAQFDRAFTSPNDFDNHEVHIEIHNRFRKSQEYEMLDDALKDEFDRHVAEHESRMQQEQLEEMMFQGGIAGDPNIQAMDEQAEDAEAEAGNQFSGVEEPEEPVNPEQSAGVDSMPAMQ